jgi:hypothetical protein
MQFWANGAAEIEVTSLGVQWPSGNQSFAAIQAFADYKNGSINELNTTDFIFASPMTHTFTLNGSGAWLSDIYNAQPNKEWLRGAQNRTIFLIMDFRVKSGSVDMNWMAHEFRANHNPYADNAPYRWDGQVKGTAPTLPKMRANLEYSIDAATESNAYMPAIVSNYYNPAGAYVNAWSTGINPQKDYFGSAYKGAESGILPLTYNDPDKVNRYGASASGKNTTWIFDARHTAMNKQVLSGTAVYRNGVFDGRELETTFDGPSNFVPNDLLGSQIGDKLSSPYDTTVDSQSYNVGYGPNVTSFDVAVNMGNYSVEMEYNVTIHNSGGPRTVEYHVSGPGNYILNAKNQLKNKGDNPNDVLMESFDVPSGTSTFTFSVVLPTGDASALDNWFILK